MYSDSSSICWTEAMHFDYQLIRIDDKLNNIDR